MSPVTSNNHSSGVSKDKVFITGGNGLLGAHLLQSIIAHTGWSIKALKRKESNLELVQENDRIEWVEGNLLDTSFIRDNMMDCGQVIHAAGKVSVSQKDAKLLKLINTKGTKSVVDAALESGITRMVYVSSVAALGRETKDMIDESSEYEEHPEVTPYSKSKHEADLEIFRCMAEGLSVNIVRPSLIVGSGHWEDGSDSIFPKAYHGVPFYPTGGTGLVDVRDVSRMIIQLVQAVDEGLDVIANGHNVKFKELQALIAKCFDNRPPKKALSTWMIHAFAAFEKVRSTVLNKTSIITTQSLKRAQSTYFYDNTRSRSLLNFAYSPLEKTIEDCCAAYIDFRRSGLKRILQTQ
jgi:nucleoside-diphosphate-sugar epimerase